MEQPRNEDSGWAGKGNISVPAYLRKNKYAERFPPNDNPSVQNDFDTAAISNFRDSEKLGNGVSSLSEITKKSLESSNEFSSFNNFLSQSKRQYAYLDSEEFAHVYDPEIEKKLLTSDGVKILLEKLSIDTNKLEVEVKNRTYDEVIDEGDNTHEYIMGSCTRNDSEIILTKNNIVVFRTIVTLKVKHF